MTRPNIPLLRKAVEWVEAQDQLPKSDREWLQDLYVLPTPDRAREALGEQFCRPERWSEHHREHEGITHCNTCFCVAGKIQFDATGSINYFTAGEIAARELGLTQQQATRLFDGANSAEDVRRIAEEIAGEKL